jgi:hypothetical protein
MVLQPSPGYHETPCVTPGDHETPCVTTACLALPQCEMRMAKAVEDLAATTPGKKSLAMGAFARALRALPATICDNAGLDSAEVGGAGGCWGRVV